MIAEYHIGSKFRFELQQDFIHMLLFKWFDISIDNISGQDNQIWVLPVNKINNFRKPLPIDYSAQVQIGHHNHMQIFVAVDRFGNINFIGPDHRMPGIPGAINKYTDQQRYGPQTDPRRQPLP